MRTVLWKRKNPLLLAYSAELFFSLTEGTSCILTSYHKQASAISGNQWKSGNKYT